MKINQVEELVDITKKNIRFYEDQGLVAPRRNPENGYRDYTMKDVEILHKIKLLRMLGVSCEDIRRMEAGELSMRQCMMEQSESLTRQQKDIEHMKEMCTLLASDESDFSSIKAEDYLDRMKKLERGGVQFMNVKKSDVKTRATGAILAGVIMIVFMLAVMVAFLLACAADPAPIGVYLIGVAAPIAIVVGIVVVLRQRLKELKGGELDEANKY